MDLRRITLHQLRLFLSLGKHLSFTRAADELHLTQPAVSIQIKRLEDTVGVPLVEQMGKRIFLTSSGKELLSASQDIQDRLNVLCEYLTGIEKGTTGSLNIAAITTAKYFMPYFLSAFLCDYPEIKPTLTITNQSKIIKRLHKNLDDIVIMGRAPQDHFDLEVEYFLNNPLVVVAPADHHLVGRKNIPLETISRERFVSREVGSGTREASHRIFAKHDLSAQIYMELGSSEAIKQAVMAGLGVSVLSKHILRLELDAGLIAILDVQQFPLQKQWYAIHLKGKKLSNSSRLFLDFLLKDSDEVWQKMLKT